MQVINNLKALLESYGSQHNEGNSRVRALQLERLQEALQQMINMDFHMIKFPFKI